VGRRIQVKGPLPKAIVLFVLSAAVLWSGHWMLTCIGSPGQVSFSERKSLLGPGYTWGHTSAVMWAEKGQTITVRYSVRMRETGRVSFQLRKWRWLWQIGTPIEGWETVYVRASEDGSITMIAPKSGIYRLNRSESSVWKGEATVTWDVQ
jgi:hypothetical protein